MIEEIGIVEKLDGDFAIISVERGSMCGNCPSKNVCHPFSDGDNKITITAINKINAKVGDKVLLKIDDKNFLKASFIVYGIPIVILLVFSIIGKLLFKKDIFSFIVGFGGMIISYIGIKYYDRKNSEKFKPEIKELINENSCN